TGLLVKADELLIVVLADEDPREADLDEVGHRKTRHRKGHVRPAEYTSQRRGGIVVVQRKRPDNRKASFWFARIDSGCEWTRKKVPCSSRWYVATRWSRATAGESRWCREAEWSWKS